MKEVVRKTLHTLILSFILGFNLMAQDVPEITGDTLRYLGKSYYPGQILQLKYGNGPGRTFIFVKFNSAMMYSDAVPQNYSNTQIEILKIEDLKGKFYMKAQSKRTKSIRFSIDFQGAIDMGEIN